MTLPEFNGQGIDAHADVVQRCVGPTRIDLFDAPDGEEGQAKLARAAVQRRKAQIGLGQVQLARVDLLMTFQVENDSDFVKALFGRRQHEPFQELVVARLLLEEDCLPGLLQSRHGGFALGMQFSSKRVGCSPTATSCLL
jgi:hypothetical protein